MKVVGSRPAWSEGDSLGGFSNPCTCGLKCEEKVMVKRTVKYEGKNGGQECLSQDSENENECNMDPCPGICRLLFLQVCTLA